METQCPKCGHELKITTKTMYTKKIETEFILLIVGILLIIVGIAIAAKANYELVNEISKTVQAKILLSGGDLTPPIKPVGTDWNMVRAAGNIVTIIGICITSIMGLIYMTRPMIKKTVTRRHCEQCDYDKSEAEYDD